MMHARFMYLRPGNLFNDFAIEENGQEVTSTGRAVVGYSSNEGRMLKGCLAEATEEEREGHSVSDHVVTHTIVQSGPPKAKRTDRLVLGDRVFYIVDIDDTGMLGIATLYYAEERRDVK